jgi:hypothetical protein
MPKRKRSCGYEGSDFGANYPDSVCIDGYLWDADVCDGGGMLTGGPQMPCPQCQPNDYIRYNQDSIESEGYDSFDKPNSDPSRPSRLKHLPANQRRLVRRFWRRGRRERVREEMKLR